MIFQGLKRGRMKTKLFVIGAGFVGLMTSCSTMDLGGSVPLPFTEPSTSAQLDLNLRPMPPRVCIGVDLVPPEEESDTGETAE